MNNKIEAIFDSDLDAVLKDLELFDKLQAGKIKCTFCGTTITKNNLQYIFTRNNKIVV